MTSPRQALIAAALLLVAASAAHAAPPAVRPAPSSPTAQPWTLPLAFERNEGQLPAEIEFLGRTQRYTVAVNGKDLRFSLPGTKGASPVVLSFEGAGDASATGLAESTFRTNYYLGPDPSKYRSGIHNFTRIGLRHLYTGIDAEFYATGEDLEHDFVIAPNADPAIIKLGLRSPHAAKLSESGDIVIPAEEGELRLRKPIAYQTASTGAHTEIPVAFVLNGGNGEQQSLRFHLGSYDHARPLVIDPVIVYATYAAGTAGSTATAIATDPANNVYLAGTTASTVFASSPTPTVNCGAAPCAYNVFVAQLAAASKGSALNWITFIGASQNTSTTTVRAIVANTSTVYIGGSTSDTALASGPATTAPNTTGGYVGYLSSLASASGALNTTALLYLDATATNGSVQALALDTANNLYATGALGSTTAPAVQLLAPSPNAFAVAPATTAYVNSASPQPGNAFVAEFAAGSALAAPTTFLATPSFFTYVQTNTQINGLGVDGTGSIYLGGHTTASTFGTIVSPTATNSNPGMNDAFGLTFTLNTGTTPPAVSAFTWIDGNADDTIAALALAGSGRSYLLGNTTSTNLPATTGVVQPAPADTAGNGFAALLDANNVSPGTGSTTPIYLTYLGGSGTVDKVTGGAFANGSLYLTGQTNAPPTTAVSPPGTAFASVPTTVATSAAPFNPQALAFGMDVTGGTAQRGFLASLAANLASVNYVANVGGPGGTDIANAVALDTSANAYVAGTVSLGSVPYTSYSAYQTASLSTASPSAYVAEITYTDTATGLTLAPATGSPSINPVGYVSSSNASAPVYTWTLTAPAATGNANLIVQIPTVPQLTYTSASVTDAGSANPPIACAIAAGGAYCVIPAVPQTGGVNDTVQIVLNTTVAASTLGATGSFTVSAIASSAASEYVTSAQTNTLAAPSVLTITPAATFGATTVFSTNTGATSPMTQATYAFTVANTGAGASPNTSFTLTLPSNFHVAGPISITTTGVSGTPTCDTSSAATGCTAINLPAGASLAYSLTGTYADAAVGASGSSAATPNFSAAASGFLSTATNSIAPNTTVERGVHLRVVGTLSPPPAPQTAFNLGDSFTYTIVVTNSGPSATSGTDPLTVTLPAGFAPTAGSGGTALSCAPPYTTCTVTLPIIAAGASTTYAVTGSFPDTVTNQTVLGTPQARAFTAVIALPLVNSFESGGPASDYTSTASINIQRTAVLTVTSILAPPASVCAGHSAACVYMQNSADTGDKVPYSFVVQNAGPNTAVNARVTITLPFVPANPAGTPHPLNPGALTESVPPPSFGTALTCTYTPGTNQIVCTGGNLPVAASALAISGNATIDPASVPTTTAFVTTADAAGSVTILEDANGAPSPATLPSIEVDRAAHLVTTKQVVPSGTTPASPINLDENAPNLAAGVNDTLTVTIQVGDTPLNAAPGVVVTETLPAYFRLTQPPPAFANCTAGAPAAPLPANFLTQGTPVVLSCAIGTVAAGTAMASVPGTPAAVTAGFISFTYAGKFEDNGINADITGTLAAKVKQLTASLPTATSITPVAVDPLAASDATSGAPSIAVIRAAHLILRKTRNANVAAAPPNFIDTTDPNLDEKTTATSFGVNDEVEYEIAIGNGGVNKALGVQFTETLPPFFTLVKTYMIAGAATLPDTGANTAPAGQLSTSSLACYAGSTLGTTPLMLPYTTGASAMPITCGYGTPAAPLALSAGPSHTGAPDNATSVEFVYQGKYQDNAPAADNIGPGVSTYTVASTAGDAFATPALAVDNGPATDSRSLALPFYAIQRAAHLSVVGTPLQLKPDETALTGGGFVGTSIVAQAEPSSTGATTPVFNCLRYKVLLANSGPNIARQPQLTLTPSTALNLTSSPNAITTTPGTDAPLPSSCAYGTTIPPTITGATLAPTTERAGNTLVLDVDAYFGLDTLAANAQTGFALSYTALSDPGIKDSNKNTPFASITGSPLTVVNTPAGTNFFVSPFSGTGSRPARIAFGTVTTPGITTESIAATGPAMPSGSSPDPRDNRKSISLYRTGTAPSFYSFGTTAVPAAGANPTGICLTSGTSSPTLPDGFAKPERVLLWTLAGLPAGTALNSVPNVASPYTGDITTGVAASAFPSYVEAGGPALPYTSAASFPTPQSQPAQVCGQINGFAPASAPVTVAVLEPVNFAPLISTTTTQQVPQAPGKGVSEVSFLFPQTVHDYNDSDPCYVATSTSGTATRGTCDDNLVLSTWIFGGENLVPTLNHVVGPLPPAAAQAFLDAPIPYEVQAGATLFLQVADQLGLLAYNATQDCDPGNAPGSYNPVATVKPCPINTTSLSGTPPQEADFAGSEIALLTPSVNGGSSGLTVLPPAADPTSATTAVQVGYTTASATVTAGQTAGLQWRLGGIVPAAGGTYNLTCFLVDNATQNVPAAFPAGLSCQIPASIVYPPNHTTANSPADPAIYVVTSGTSNARNVIPSWRSAVGGISAALLLPVILFRRRLAHGSRLWILTVLLLLAGSLGISGCGAGFNATATSTALAPGTYSFRASASPVGGGTTLTTAPFQLKVVAGD